MVKTTPGTENIEDDIRTTRRSIDDKIERIQERLSPGDIVDNVLGFAKTNGGAIAGGIGRTVRDNPVPAAMIGAGIVWLALSTRAQRRSDDDGTDMVDQGKATMSKLRDRAATVGSDLRERAGELGEKARTQAVRAKDGTGRFVKDHPLLVGAAGIAMGAAIAASLPRSNREDRAFGERSDRVKQAAKEAALKEGRKVQEAAKAAVKKAKETVDPKTSPTAAQSDVNETTRTGSAH